MKEFLYALPFAALAMAIAMATAAVLKYAAAVIR
jgi:hypothetical protein